MDGLIDDDPVDRDADLALVQEFAECGGLYGVIDPALIDQNVETNIRRRELVLSAPRVSRQ